MPDLAVLSQRNAARWSVVKLTRGPEFEHIAPRLVAAKSRYLTIAARTGVPWFVVAVIHQRESSQDWSRSLAQGDPWNRVSTHVPKGRGPFRSFEDAATDALKTCPPYAARWTDWSAGGTLTLLEQYNGLGYARRGLPSPYLWSGTDQYQRGKYVADGRFDPQVVDKQLGCAGLILAMQALDSSIQFGAGSPAASPVAMSVPSGPAVVHATQAPVVPPHPETVPSVSHPAPGSLGAFIGSALAALFKKAA